MKITLHLKGPGKRILFRYFSGIVLLFCVFGCWKTAPQDRAARLLAQGNAPGGIVIAYPAGGTLFPPDISSPVFIWSDTTAQADAWYVFAGSGTGTRDYFALSEKQSWRPDRQQWASIKARSLEKELTFTIAGTRREAPDKIVSSGSVSIRTSGDSVGAAIFFRDVILPFDSARCHVDSIRYRLADISSEQAPRVLMSGLPVCGNCHSFSADGNTLGMDVDYANDKGSYVISPISEHTVLSRDKIITWSDYKKEDGQLTFGLLSQISPDGRYAVSTVKDRSIFVPVGTSLAYSQLFFPIRGILAVYDRSTGEFTSLPGADNPEFVQSNPSWSPDGRYLYFARARAYYSEKAEKSSSAVLPADAAEEFLSGGRKFKYDICRIPFNGGKGGEALPVPGASGNGMSNFFPRISPDGKWMVFTQSKSFMLLQPDSRLFIMPAAGGTPREMTCNTSEMNSWHSWSPGGKWLVFSSKVRGPYTRLFLTHIDDSGMDSPPVYIENLLPDRRAANIPEFVNRRAETWTDMSDAFSDSGNYTFRVAKNKLHYQDLAGAESTFNTAAEVEPENYAVFLERGILLSRKGDFPNAKKNFERALALSPGEAKVHYNMGAFLSGTGDFSGAVKSFNRALQLMPEDIESLYRRGLAKQKQKDFRGAMSDCSRILEIRPDFAPAFNLRGLSKSELGRFAEALPDYNRAIALDSAFPDPYLNRGYAKHQLGDTQGGLKDLDTYNALLAALKNRRGL